MSRPRAATSVATSTCSLPSLNCDNASSRAACVLSPWIADVASPSFSSWRASRDAPCFVLRQPVRALRNGFGGGVAACDLDQPRRVEQLVGESLDLVGERCGKEQILPLRRQQRHD